MAALLHVLGVGGTRSVAAIDATKDTVRPERSREAAKSKGYQRQRPHLAIIHRHLPKSENR